MANINSPCGLKPLDTITSAEFSGKIHTFIIPSSDSSRLYMYDGVKLTGCCGTAGIPYITKAYAGASLIGSVVEIKNIATHEQYNYREPYQELFVTVLIDPFAKFEAQVNGILTTSDIGKLADLVVVDGDFVIGVSHSALDMSTLSNADSKQIMILGLVERQGNEIGLYSKVVCMIAEHQLKDINLEASYWNYDLVTNTLYPRFSDANIDLSGDLHVKKDFHVEGKATIDGLLDPTGLILAPQSAPPSTSDGTHYYDSIIKKHTFKENGQWVNYITEAGEKLWNRVGTSLFPFYSGDNLDMRSGQIIARSFKLGSTGQEIANISTNTDLDGSYAADDVLSTELAVRSYISKKTINSIFYALPLKSSNVTGDGVSYVIPFNVSDPLFNVGGDFKNDWSRYIMPNSGFFDSTLSLYLTGIVPSNNYISISMIIYDQADYINYLIPYLFQAKVSNLVGLLGNDIMYTGHVRFYLQKNFRARMSVTVGGNSTKNVSVNSSAYNTNWCGNLLYRL